LEQTPEIKVLEKKLGMIGDVNDALDKAVEGLEKIVDFNKMILPKEGDEDKKEENAANELNNKREEMRQYDQ